MGRVLRMVGSIFPNATGTTFSTQNLTRSFCLRGLYHNRQNRRGLHGTFTLFRLSSKLAMVSRGRTSFSSVVYICNTKQIRRTGPRLRHRPQSEAGLNLGAKQRNGTSSNSCRFTLRQLGFRQFRTSRVRTHNWVNHMNKRLNSFFRRGFSFKPGRNYEIEGGEDRAMLNALTRTPPRYTIRSSGRTRNLLAFYPRPPPPTN